MPTWRLRYGSEIDRRITFPDNYVPVAGVRHGGNAARVDGGLTAFGIGETFPTGLASHGGILYMIGAGGDALYTLDITIGTIIRVRYGSLDQRFNSADGRGIPFRINGHVMYPTYEQRAT